MARELYENDDVECSVLRANNRALRTENRKLRERVRNLSEEKEDMFIAICETKTEAELALQELWANGGFECGPEDYDLIVERSIEIINR